MSSSWPNPPLERTLFGWDPLDEMALHIGDWILSVGSNHPNLEIEAKVGVLVEGQGEGARRISSFVPVSSETILQMRPGWRFEANLEPQQHKLLNELLNRRVEETRGQLTYERRREVDYFHDDDRRGGPSGGGARIRVTRDESSLQIKPNGIVRKRRLADLNILCPNRPLDYRISINVEEPIAEEPRSEPSSHRIKNRLHYCHQLVSVDLTQVTNPSNPSRPVHELEVEFRDADALVREGQMVKSQANSVDGRGQQQEWTPYDDKILIFLNNVRMLIRNAAAAG